MTPARIGPNSNPLRDERDKRLPRIAGPCGLVIFGVTGDLARKKLMPAVYDLSQRGLLPPGFALVGFARRDWATQDFAQVVHDAVKQYARTRSGSRSGGSCRTVSVSCRAVSTTTTPSTTWPARSTSWTRCAAPAGTTPSTCRSRRARSRW